MSEPFSAVLRVKIPRPKLLSYFANSPLPASHWQDWSEATRGWNRFDSERELPPLIAEADRKLSGNYLQHYRTLLNPEYSAMSRLHYDHAAGTFIFANLEFSGRLDEFIFFLAVVRGIAPFLTGPDKGFAILHNYLWGERKETLASVGLEAGASRFLNNPENVDAYENSIQQGVLLLDGIVGDGPNYDIAASNDRIESFVR